MYCTGKGESEKRNGFGASTFNFEGDFFYKDGKLHENSRVFGDDYSEEHSAVLVELELAVPKH